MDQTTLQFDFIDGKTYDTRGAATVWLKSQGSGLDKRQVTVQLTIHADGEPRTRPLVIFKGTGKRIPPRRGAVRSTGLCSVPT